MSKNAQTTKHTLPELDLEDLRQKIELGAYPEVSIALERVDGKGHPRQIPGFHNVLIPITDVAQLPGIIPSLIPGGGRYRVKVKDPRDPTHDVVQQFYVEIEGREIPIHLSPGGGQPPAPPVDAFGVVDPALAAASQQPALSPVIQALPPNPQAPGLPGWTEGLRATLASNPRQHYGYGPAFVPGAQPQQPPPGQQRPFAGYATYTPDAIALRQSQKLESRLERLEAEREADRKRHDDEMAKLNVERERERREYEKRERDLRDQQFQAQIAAMQQQLMAAQQRPAMNPIEMMVPFVPVLTAFVQSSKERDLKMMELQAAQMNRPAPDPLAVLAPIMNFVGPLLADQLKGKSPEAQAALFNALTESQLNTIGMMAQLVEHLAGDSENKPWWLDPVQEALEGALKVGEAFFEVKKEEAASKNRPPALAAPKPPAPESKVIESAPAQPPGPVPTSPSQVASDGPPATPEQMEALKQLSPEQLVDILMQHPQIPTDLKTNEWKQLFLLIHRKEDVDELAFAFAGHVENLARLKMLPEILREVLERPAEVLAVVLGGLPIAQLDADYTNKLHAAILDELEQGDEDEAPKKTKNGSRKIPRKSAGPAPNLSDEPVVREPG